MPKLELRRKLYTVLSYIIPKQKGLIVFFPTHNKKAFSGNLKSLILYAHQHADLGKYKLVWCTNDEILSKELQEKGYLVVQKRLSTHLKLLRAQLIIQEGTYSWLIGK